MAVVVPLFYNLFDVVLENVSFQFSANTADRIQKLKLRKRERRWQQR